MKNLVKFLAIAPMLFASVLIVNAQEKSAKTVTAANVEIVKPTMDAQMEGQDVLAMLKGQKDLTTFATALKASGLVDKINGGEYTILAPTNEAFKALPAGTIEKLLMPENKEKLVQILSNHIFTGSVNAEQAAEVDNLSSWSGQEIPVNVGSAGVYFGDAKVQSADLKTDNGMIHTIDKVIM